MEAAAARYLVHHCQVRTDGGGSRYCARCLAEPDSWWRADWANPLLPLCLRHQVYLQSVCPGCGQVPWTGTAWMRPGPTVAVPAAPTQRPDPATGKCETGLPHDLCEAPALPAPAKLCTASRL